VERDGLSGASWSVCGSGVGVGNYPGGGGSNPDRDWEFFSSPPRPDRLWDPPSLLSNGYQGLFPWGMKLTTHVHLMPKSIMRGAILSLPQYNSMAWCSMKIKHRDNFTLRFFSTGFYSPYRTLVFLNGLLDPQTFGRTP
jgi:hypothetical protein